MLVSNIWGFEVKSLLQLNQEEFSYWIQGFKDFILGFPMYAHFLRLKWYTTALYNMHVADPFMERVESSTDSAHPVSLRIVSECL